jgi:charged multivesicular body protein 3
MVKVTGTLQASTEIMKASNSLIKLPQLSGTMREMSAEMMKVRSLPASGHCRVTDGTLCRPGS